MTHGTKGAYDRHKCRCDACRAANTAYQRQRRAGLVSPVPTPRPAVKPTRNPKPVPRVKVVEPPKTMEELIRESVADLKARYGVDA